VPLFGDNWRFPAGHRLRLDLQRSGLAHLVAIDGLTRSTKSRWCGLFFSLGHGLVVTLVGIAVAVVASDWQVPRWLEHTGAWVSIGVLLALGVANLLAVLRAAPGQQVALVGLKSRWLPEQLARASHPAVIAAVGTFLPCYLFTIIPAPYFRKHGKKPAIVAFVDGCTAAAIGTIAGAVVVLGKRSITDIPTIAIMAVTLILLWKVKKIPEPAIVALAALAGVVVYPLVKT